MYVEYFLHFSTFTNRDNPAIQNKHTIAVQVKFEECSFCKKRVIVPVNGPNRHKESCQALWKKELKKACKFCFCWIPAITFNEHESVCKLKLGVKCRHCTQWYSKKQLATHESLCNLSAKQKKEQCPKCERWFGAGSGITRHKRWCKFKTVQMEKCHGCGYLFGAGPGITSHKHSCNGCKRQQNQTMESGQEMKPGNDKVAQPMVNVANILVISPESYGYARTKEVENEATGIKSGTEVSFSESELHANVKCETNNFDSFEQHRDGIISQTKISFQDNVLEGNNSSTGASALCSSNTMIFSTSNQLFSKPKSCKKDIIIDNLDNKSKGIEVIQCSVCDENFENMTNYTHHLNVHLQSHT